MKALEVLPYNYEKQLSKNFTLGELIQSNTAYSQKIVMQYVFQRRIEDNLTFLCKALLQPIRDVLGVPLIISSGYRCSATNMAVGGAKNSYHIQGLAADVVCKGRENLLIEIVKRMEYHEMLVYKSYIHLSIKQEYNQKLFRDYR